MAQSSTKEQTGRGRLPVARRDRRPALAALAVLLILLGALGSALVAFRSGDRSSVLVAAHDIPIGKVISSDDFVKTSVAGDSGYMLSASAANSLVDQRASVGVPKGTLVNAGMFTDKSLLPAGSQLVGVVVNTTQRTSNVPAPGEVVRIYYVSGASAEQGGSGGGRTPGENVVAAARVVYVSTGRSGDSRNITVLVRDQAAGEVAELASSGHLAMTVLPIGSKPIVDLVAGS